MSDGQQIRSSEYLREKSPSQVIIHEAIIGGVLIDALAEGRSIKDAKHQSSLARRIITNGVPIHVEIERIVQKIKTDTAFDEIVASYEK